MEFVIIDSCPLSRIGFAYFLEGHSADVVIHQAASFDEALAYSRQRSPRLSFVDARLLTESGVGSLNQLRQAVPDMPVVVISDAEDPNLVRQCIIHGASGFISKLSSPEEFSVALAQVLAGNLFFPSFPLVEDANAPIEPDMVERRAAILSSLSERQREVLKYLVQGKPNKTISTHMSISQNTVKSHLSVIFRALGARNRTEAVYFAARAGIPLE